MSYAYSPPNRKIQKKRMSRPTKFFLLLIAVLSFKAFISMKFLPVVTGPTKLSKLEVAQYLDPQILNHRVHSKNQTLQLTLNEGFQHDVGQLFNRSNLSHYSVVAMDPKTGEILSFLASENEFNLKAQYPAASLFKVITAAAAIEDRKLNPRSLIPYSGSHHTLYKRSLFASGGLTTLERPRNTQTMSLEDAFAKSVNSIFGKIGILALGHEKLAQAAENFYFGKPIPFELALEKSQADIPEDLFGIAESASGFTRRNLLSPLHAALIASSIANEGVMMEPSIVKKWDSTIQKMKYEFEPKVLAQVMSANTAQNVAKMMERTITHGTSRKSFRHWNGRGLASRTALRAGGKTGSLDGDSPPGRYDWFIGFASEAKRSLAIAVLCVHGSVRGIKASLIARRAFEIYFQKYE